MKLNESQKEVVNYAIKYKRKNVEFSNIFTYDGYNVSVVIVFQKEIIEKVAVKLIKFVQKFKLEKFYRENRGYVTNEEIYIEGKSYSILLTILPITHKKDDMDVSENVFIFENNEGKIYKMNLIRIELMA